MYIDVITFRTTFVYISVISRPIILNNHMFCHIYVTHLEIQVFLRFSGELVSFRKLGQLDLYILLLSSLGSPMSTIHPMGPACVRFTPGPPENRMPP